MAQRLTTVSFQQGLHIVKDPSIPQLNFSPVVKRNLQVALRCPYRQNKESIHTWFSNKNNAPAMSKNVDKTIFKSNMSHMKSGIQSSSTLKKQVSFKSHGTVASSVSKNSDLFINPKDIKQGENGKYYVHMMVHNKSLRSVFGVGGWCLYPMSDLIVDPLILGDEKSISSILLSRCYGLVCQEMLVATVQSEMVFTIHKSKYGVETMRSNAISMLSQKVGLGLAVS